MKEFGAELKRHVLTTIFYVLPLAATPDLLIAVGNLMGGEVAIDLGRMTTPGTSTSPSVSEMGLPPLFIAGYISYSTAGRPGITPGFLMGQVVSFLGVGSLGGMVGGYIIGYIALSIRKYPKVPHWVKALMPMMTILILSSIIAGLLMYFVIDTPIVWLTKGLTNFITGLDQSSKVLYGLIIDVLECPDFGSPISKVPNLIYDGLLLEGILEPETIKVLTAIIPPLGIALSLVISKFIKRRIYTSTEVENIRVAFPAGLCTISEGVIPATTNDLICTIICTSIGHGVTGAISFTLGVGGVVSSGGVFAIPTMTNPFTALFALLTDTHVTAVLLVLTKKKRTDASEVQVEEVEEEMDLSGITFS